MDDVTRHDSGPMLIGEGEEGVLRPGLEFVYEAGGNLLPPREIGKTVDGARRIIPILEGGYVKGPKISGKLMGNAADWQLTRLDGVTVADAIYAIECDDGTLIQIRNTGLRHGPDEVMERLRAGEDVDPTEYYFRTVPQFIAPVGAYDWMNKSIFVCSGARYASSIKLWVWRVT
ncbi:MAG: DUF3237 domain-containing protein [Sphingomonadaceae bacterium]|jgi:hypothetical protein